LEGGKLQTSPVNIQMKLSSTANTLKFPPSFPLADGSTSWEQVFNAAVSIWNAVLADLQLTTTTSPDTNLGTEDGINEDYFGTTVGGFTLDQNTSGSPLTTRTERQSSKQIQPSTAPGHGIPIGDRC
jgi:hypothetical protein